MRRLITLLAIIATACVFGGLYGVLHDQVTYSISSEYYTRFKFFQFGFCSTDTVCILENPRVYAGLVGLLATWWTGIPIGLGLGLAALKFSRNVVMFRVAIKAILCVLLVTIICGMIGLLIGYTYLAPNGVSWHLPEGLQNREDYIAVGSIHNFSYLGGLLGMICGIVYILVQRKKMVDDQ